jgi:hypothetical protein
MIICLKSAEPKSHMTDEESRLLGSKRMLLLLFISLFSQTFLPRYLSWTNGDPHRSGFKFQTASPFRIMYDVPGISVSFREFIERFPSTVSKCLFITFVTIPYGCSFYRHNHTFRVPHWCTSIYKAFNFNFFSDSFVWYCSLILLSLSVFTFSLFCLNYYIRPLSKTFFISA